MTAKSKKNAKSSLSKNGRKATLLLPKKEIRFSKEQTQVIREVEKRLKKKLGLGKKGFSARYFAIIPTTDEVVQMGVHTAAACMTRAIRERGFTKLQREVIGQTRRRLISEMDFTLDLTWMPDDAYINRVGKTRVTDELYHSSRYWSRVCR